MRKNLLKRMNLAGQYAEMADRALGKIKVGSKAQPDQRSFDTIVMQGWLTKPAGPLD